MNYIWKHLSKYKREAILAPLFKMLEALFDLFVPLVVANIINIGIAKGNKTYIYKQIGLLIILALVGITCSVIAQYFAAKASVKTASNIRKELFDHIETLGYKELDELGSSTLITRMTSDINSIQNGINLALRLLLRSPFIVFGAMVMAFTINAKISLVFLATIIILSIIVYTIMSITNPGFKNIQKRLDKVTSATRENLTGVRVVRAFGKEEEEIEQFNQANMALNRMQRRIGQISGLMNPLTYIVVNLAIIAIIYYGANLVNAGILLSGDVVALVNYINQILVELVKLANTIISISKTMASSNRISDVLNTKSSMVYGTQYIEKNEQEPVITFDHVSLSYNQSGEESLTDISFQIQRGQTIGIIGGTGSGKSTLVSLIARFYDVSSGKVLLEGTDIKEYPKEQLRGKIHVVMQKAQLFKGTIRSNLLWGGLNATDEDLWKALEIAQASEVVKGKAKGLDEEVEQGGRNFSGGQKQRLTIARALVSKADILILDDSASALDFATDASLRKAIHNLEGNMTTFIVSQRTSSIMHADLILVLDDGLLVGKGTHQELLESCEVYKEIYESQFKKGGK